MFSRLVCDRRRSASSSIRLPPSLPATGASNPSFAAMKDIAGLLGTPRRVTACNADLLATWPLLRKSASTAFCYIPIDPDGDQFVWKPPGQHLGTLRGVSCSPRDQSQIHPR